jgi:hypothetical protein
LPQWTVRRGALVIPKQNGQNVPLAVRFGETVKDRAELLAAVFAGKEIRRQDWDQNPCVVKYVIDPTFPFLAPFDAPSIKKDLNVTITSLISQFRLQLRTECSELAILVIVVSIAEEGCKRHFVSRCMFRKTGRGGPSQITSPNI